MHVLFVPCRSLSLAFEYRCSPFAWIAKAGTLRLHTEELRVKSFAGCFDQLQLFTAGDGLPLSGLAGSAAASLYQYGWAYAVKGLPGRKVSYTWCNITLFHLTHCKPSSAAQPGLLMCSLFMLQI
jgi:hypothetical protein